MAKFVSAALGLYNMLEGLDSLLVVYEMNSCCNWIRWVTCKQTNATL